MGERWFCTQTDIVGAGRAGAMRAPVSDRPPAGGTMVAAPFLYGMPTTLRAAAAPAANVTVTLQSSRAGPAASLQEIGVPAPSTSSSIVPVRQDAGSSKLSESA